MGACLEFHDPAIRTDSCGAILAARSFFVAWNPGVERRRFSGWGVSGADAEDRGGGHAGAGHPGRALHMDRVAAVAAESRQQDL